MWMNQAVTQQAGDVLFVILQAQALPDDTTVFFFSLHIKATILANHQ